IDTLQLMNFQCFADSGATRLGPLVVIAGKNNSGKSAILNSIRYLQDGLQPQADVVRIGAQQAIVLMQLSDIPASHRRTPDVDSGLLSIGLSRGHAPTLHFVVSAESGEPKGEASQTFKATLPEAVILPILTERTGRYIDEQINREATRQIRADMGNVGALLSPLLNPSNPMYPVFLEASDRLLNLRIGLVASQNGQTPGVVVEGATIPITAMGTGVLSMVRMLAYLIGSNGKILLIEEPENDLHPEALKHILALIREAATRNQVILTTHSHIVVNVLGGEKSCTLLRVDMALKDGMPTSLVTPCEAMSHRIALLRELGNELTDFGLHDAFLVLEESSAESIVQNLIRWFTPALVGRLRTVAAYGVDDVEPRVSDLLRMFVYVHLEEVYRDRAWAVVDGDSAGWKVVDRLKEKLPQWDPDHFVALDKPDFELYYPEPFLGRATEALAETNQDRRRALKQELLQDVLAWVDSENNEAKALFANTAAPVIDILRKIERQLAFRGAPAPTRPRAPEGDKGQNQSH
ncbi:MAG TPA: ATP-binding protein, partial [Nitrospira sp.]|nr:ATP-binding protein [Nitrospira sp.]